MSKGVNQLQNCLKKGVTDIVINLNVGFSLFFLNISAGHV
jgi:hypothetical protein